MPTAGYRTLLRRPGAAPFVVAAGAGRIGLAGTGLALVWLVHAATGSYATAGLVTGAFAVAEAVVAPQVARLVDVHGQTRVLPVVLAAHVAAMAILLVMVASQVPAWGLAAGGLALGASLPQLGALSAARWSALLHAERDLLPTAFALESLSNALAYLVGPVLVSAVAATGSAWSGAVMVTTLVVAGGLVLSGQRRTAPPVTGRRTDGGEVVSGSRRPLLRTAFVVLVAVNAAIGVYFGAMQVSVAAFAVEQGTPETASALYAVSSGTGLLAGWLYGLRRWRTTPPVQLVVATAALALVCTLLPTSAGPVRLAVVLAATGLAVPPILVLSAVLTEAGVDRGVLTQAFTWLSSASAAGAAGAAALAGHAIDVHGARGGFTVAVVAAGSMAILAGAGLPALRRGECGLSP